MPVEIKELIIRAVVGGDEKNTPEPAADARTTLSEDFIQECVNQVLKVLERHRER